MEKLKEEFKDTFSQFTFQQERIRRLWNISEETAHLIYMLVRMKAPGNILEIGTSNGYSTFWLSLAAQHSKAQIQTIEVDKERFELAKENLLNRKNIKLHLGKAESIIPELDMKFDFVFIDAGKIGYINYIKLLINKMNENAVIIADNIISHEDTVKEYLDFIKTNKSFVSVTLGIGTGLEISIYNSSNRE